MSKKELLALPAPGLDDQGREVPDQRPVAVPVGFGLPEALPDMVRRLTSAALSTQAGLSDMESWEESDDFEVDDGFQQSPYDEKFDPSFTGTKVQEQRAGFRGARPAPSPPPPPPPVPPVAGSQAAAAPIEPGKA